MTVSVAYTSVDLTYSHDPYLVDFRGAMVAEGKPPLFTSYTMGSEHVAFDHAARYCRVGTTEAHVFVAGQALAEEAMGFLFSILEMIRLARIRSMTLTRFYAVPDNRPLADLVAELDAAIRVPRFNPHPIGTLADIGTIWSLDRDGRKLNYQFGPMGREQWHELAGDKLIPAEPNLPEVGWGIGLYDREPYQARLDLKAAKQSIDEALVQWETLVAQTVLKDVP